MKNLPVVVRLTISLQKWNSEIRLNILPFLDILKSEQLGARVRCKVILEQSEIQISFDAFSNNVSSITQQIQKYFDNSNGVDAFVPFSFEFKNILDIPPRHTDYLEAFENSLSNVLISAMSGCEINYDSIFNLAFCLNISIVQFISDSVELKAIETLLMPNPLTQSMKEKLESEYIVNKNSALELKNEILILKLSKDTDECEESNISWIEQWILFCKNQLALPSDDVNKYVSYQNLFFETLYDHIVLSNYHQILLKYFVFMTHISGRKDFKIIDTGQIQNSSTRELWLHYLNLIAYPVLSNLAIDGLKDNMKVDLSVRIDNKWRDHVGYLEAFARTLCGIAPWMNLEGGDKAELQLKTEYRQLALKSIENGVNPAAKDYFMWEGPQALVDASYLALAFLRCPWLWENLSYDIKKMLVSAFKSTREILPIYSNWILFPAMIEAFFCNYGLDYDVVRLQYSIRTFMNQWYTGDGLFSDGPDFNLDYYNSIAIHPFLANILEVQKDDTYKYMHNRLEIINQRYAEIMERMINVDGTFPLLGRSITYRTGIFHHLADVSLRKKLPHSLAPAQVRTGLTEVIKRTFSSNLTFRDDGFLNIGVHGHQPNLADVYITTGSLYMCAQVFLPLGLPMRDAFWTDADVPWTSAKIWNGHDSGRDKALNIGHLPY